MHPSIGRRGAADKSASNESLTGSFSASATIGSLVCVLSTLLPGEVASAISPNDGRVQLANGGTTLVVGSTTSSAGTKPYTITTSRGKQIAVSVSVSASAGGQVSVSVLPTLTAAGPHVVHQPGTRYNGPTNWEQWAGVPLLAADIHIGRASATDYTDSDVFLINCVNYPGNKMISLPMYWADGTASLAGAAAGNYTSQWTTAINNILGALTSQSTIMLRLGWEFNNSFQPWGIVDGNGPNATLAANYVTAFQKFVTLARSITNKFKFIWCANMGDYDYAPGYPGDAYVDYIGMDFYHSPQYLSGPAATDPDAGFANCRDRSFGLAAISSFAQSHNKPLVIPEWACNSANFGKFVDDFFAWAATNNVYYQAWWDSDDAYYSAISDGEYTAVGEEYRHNINPVGYPLAVPQVAEIGSMRFETTSVTSGLALAGGNRTALGVSSGIQQARIMPYVQGKSFYAFDCSLGGGNNAAVGFISRSITLGSAALGAVANSLAYNDNGTVVLNGATLATIDTWGTGTTVEGCYDPTAHLAWFRVITGSTTGNWNGNASANPATGVGGIAANLGTAVVHPVTQVLPRARLSVNTRRTAPSGFAYPPAAADLVLVGTPAIGTPNFAYSWGPTAQGGVSPYTYTHTGDALPSGISFNTSTGVFSGTETALVTVNQTITVTDANGVTSTFTAPIVFTNLWTESQISSATVLDFDAANAATIDAANSNWTDTFNGVVAGNGNSGRRPAYDPTGFNGFPCWDFTSGNSDCFSVTMPGAAPVTNNPFVLAMVVKDGGASGTEYLFGAGQYSGNQRTLSFGNNQCTISADGVSVTGGGFKSGYAIIVVEFDGTNGLRLSVNGAAVVTAAGTPNLPYYEGAYIGANLPQTLYSFFSGSIAQVMLFNRVFTADELQRFVGRLAWKYQIPYVLDSANPFTTAPPAPAGAGLNFAISGMPPQAIMGQAYSFAFTIGNGTGPYTSTITAGALPAGLTLGASGVTGTPTGSGSYSYTVKTTDTSNGKTASWTFSGRVSTKNLLAAGTSNSFTASPWSNNVPGITPNFATAANGDPMTRVQFNSSSYLSQDVPYSGSNATCSFTAKSNTGSNQTIYIYNGTTSTETALTITPTEQRITIPGQNIKNGAFEFSIYNYKGDGSTADILIADAQMEIGTSATSYVAS